MRGPDMPRRPRARIVIKRRHPHDHMWLGGAFGHQMTAATRAEMAQLAGGVLKGPPPFFAGGLAEMLPHHARGGGIGAGMRLSACAAMAMPDRHVEAVDL